MDIELDLALEAARPATAPRTPELRRAVDELLVAAEPRETSLRRRTRRRLQALSLTAGAAVLVGGAAAAHAAGWLLPQPEDGKSWDRDPAAVRVHITLPGGKACEAIYMVVPVETKAATHPPAVWDDVWSTATEYLASIDPETLASAAVTSRYRDDAMAEQRWAEQNLPPNDVPPPPTEAEIRVNAPGAELKSRVDSELRRHGLPTDLLVMTSGNTCAPGALE